MNGRRFGYLVPFRPQRHRTLARLSDHQWAVVDRGQWHRVDPSQGLLDAIPPPDLPAHIDLPTECLGAEQAWRGTSGEGMACLTLEGVRWFDEDGQLRAVWDESVGGAALAFTATPAAGGWLVVGLEEGEVMGWHPRTDERWSRRLARNGEIDVLAVGDGTLVVAAVPDRGTVLLDPVTGRRIDVSEPAKRFELLAWDVDERLIGRVGRRWFYEADGEAVSDEALPWRSPGRGRIESAAGDVVEVPRGLQTWSHDGRFVLVREQRGSRVLDTLEGTGRTVGRSQAVDELGWVWTVQVDVLRGVGPGGEVVEVPVTASVASLAVKGDEVHLGLNDGGTAVMARPDPPVSVCPLPEESEP